MLKQKYKNKLNMCYVSFRYLTYLQCSNFLNLPFQTLEGTERPGFPVP